MKDRGKQSLYASGEDYLEAILVLKKQKGMVRSVDVAGTWRSQSPASAMRWRHCGTEAFLRWTRAIFCISPM